ncbi:hypothetical protein ERX46_15065 [Brumimicrobium glaciale]|jgi:antitoxin component YwqK of YwqJK toxin-antitoxin module|uniref:Toxin-antitoxin system YwqK family antitoxin n=1 Tax=Brumimicrobium glaciale TaxID=200475 RepID=A0A4Q4KHD0_9FLAO|nr:hypothetical protein [Brumimicrobium glaciale]RYM32582.1 hypothetical protein ERX46_15065 [Brumimicrobium glaciale]
MYLNFKTTVLSLTLSLSLSIFSFSQINQVDASGKKQGEWAKTYDDSDDLRYKGQFKNDKPVGKFVYYYPNSKVRSIITHDENSNRSEAFFYHPGEQLIAHGIYRGEKKDSVWTHFLTSGHYSYSETYLNGELNGERITYYGAEAVEDPRIKLVLRKSNFVNGRQHGDFIEYFPDGVVKAEGSYVNGILDGMILRNHPNGKMMIKERWKNQEKHGWWVTYDESEKELGRIYFKEGVQLEGEDLNNYIQKLKKEGKSPNN